MHYWVDNNLACVDSNWRITEVILKHWGARELACSPTPRYTLLKWDFSKYSSFGVELAGLVLELEEAESIEIKNNGSLLGYKKARYSVFSECKFYQVASSWSGFLHLKWVLLDCLLVLPNFIIHTEKSKL